MTVPHGGFPGSALITQLFRQFTKPMSERIVAYAAKHPKFRHRLLVVPGRVYHKLRYNLEQIKNGNIVTVTRVKTPAAPVIKDEEAIQIGSQLMIEVVIFAILCFLLTCDYIRSQLRSAALEEQRQQEFEDLVEQKSIARERLKALERETEEVRRRIREIEHENATMNRTEDE